MEVLTGYGHCEQLMISVDTSLSNIACFPKNLRTKLCSEGWERCLFHDGMVIVLNSFDPVQT